MRLRNIITDYTNKQNQRAFFPFPFSIILIFINFLRQSLFPLIYFAYQCYCWACCLFFSLYQSGVNWSMSCGFEFFISSVVKSNRGGNGFPFGSLVLGSLNSSKKFCYKASMGVNLLSGLYTNNRLMRSMASSGVFCLNTLFQGWALIEGNLNSL